MSALRPTNIKAKRSAAEVMIEWNDGHTSTYSFSLLRFACPCAECRGGHDKMGSEPDPIVFNMLPEASSRTVLKSIEPVGSYALTIEWEDGHHFGIYTWHYLRALCPCSECRSK